MNKWLTSILLIGGILTMAIFKGFTFHDDRVPYTGYKVYLDGKEIGLIESKDKLYDLINNEQKEIKEQYNVDKVFPPNGFDINKYVSYDDNFIKTEDVYDLIKQKDDFTILGYKITIKNKDKQKEDIVINVIDKKIFEEATKNIINAFVSYDRYLNYLNGTQDEIVDVGEIIDSMYFEETITIKEAYIGVNDTIFTDVDELTHYMMFGSDVKEEKYTVKQGDTIASIAEDHELNSQEFLIANADLHLKNETAILAIGQTVSVDLINPVVSLTYDITKVEDAEVVYNKETKLDYSKNVGYKEITQQGVKGLARNTQKIHMVNGYSEKVDIVNTLVLREPVTEITTKGAKYTYNVGTYVDLGGEWKWPTNSPYIITSPFGYRKRDFHQGIDIQIRGGLGSPIYATKGGVVHESYWQTTGGNVIILDHQNGYFTMYAHMQNKLVQKGEVVSAGQKIGTMGCTGTACTGVHLHFGVYNGVPYYGGRAMNPEVIFK